MGTAIILFIAWFSFSFFESALASYLSRLSIKLSSRRSVIWFLTSTSYVIISIFAAPLWNVLVGESLGWIGLPSASSVFMEILVIPLLGIGFIIGLGVLIHSTILVVRKLQPGRNYRFGAGIWTIVIIVILFSLPSLVEGSIKYLISTKNFDNLIQLGTSSSCTGNTQGCTERRDIPAVLRGKKIVLATSTVAQFDSYSFSQREISTADIDGFINLTLSTPTYDKYVSPAEQKWGVLHDREFTIVRAAFDYACSYCIDSSDSGYVVLQDSMGYRFMTSLFDFSTTTRNHIPWNEQVPFLNLGTDWFLIPTN